MRTGAISLDIYSTKESWYRDLKEIKVLDHVQLYTWLITSQFKYGVELLKLGLEASSFELSLVLNHSKMWFPDEYHKIQFLKGSIFYIKASFIRGKVHPERPSRLWVRSRWPWLSHMLLPLPQGCFKHTSGGQLHLCTGNLVVLLKRKWEGKGDWPMSEPPG